MLANLSVSTLKACTTHLARLVVELLRKIARDSKSVKLYVFAVKTPPFGLNSAKIRVIIIDNRRLDRTYIDLPSYLLETLYPLFRLDKTSTCLLDTAVFCVLHSPHSVEERCGGQTK